MVTLKKKRRLSAVSQVIKTISTHPDSVDLEKSINDNEDFNFIVATDAKTRRKAYELAYRVYNNSGYIENSDGLCISDYDGGENIFTLIVETKEGEVVGTITLNFESDQDLPCDEIFKDELTSLRKMNRRLVEITRLAIAPEFQNSKTILFRMFHFIYIHACHNKNSTDFIIEVHPRHVDFYTRLLGFRQIGSAKPCGRVNGSPGALLSISIKYFSNQVLKIRSNQPLSKKERSKFALSFYGEVAENTIKEFLKGKTSAWTPAEYDMYRKNELSFFFF